MKVLFLQDYINIKNWFFLKKGISHLIPTRNYIIILHISIIFSPFLITITDSEFLWQTYEVYKLLLFLFFVSHRSLYFWWISLKFNTRILSFIMQRSGEQKSIVTFNFPWKLAKSENLFRFANRFDRQRSLRLRNATTRFPSSIKPGVTRERQSCNWISRLKHLRHLYHLA